MPKNGVQTGKPKKVPRDFKASLQETHKRVDEILDIDGTGPVPKGKVDAEQIFLMFAAFGGNIFKAAHACGVSPEEVTQLAEEGKWLDRIRALIELKKGEQGGEVERGVSRAMNFVQSNRYRLVIDRILRKFERMDDDELLEYFTNRKVDKDGNSVITSFSLRQLADLGSAMEKIHWMTYQSLCDAPQDRVGRKEAKVDDTPAEIDVHAKIAKALAGIGNNVPGVELEKAHASQVADLAESMRIQAERAKQDAPPEAQS